MGNLLSFLHPSRIKRTFCSNSQSSGLSPSQTEDSGQKGFGTSEPSEREDTKTSVSATEEKPPEAPESNDTSYGVEATAVRTLAASTGTVAILGTTAKVKDSKEEEEEEEEAKIDDKYSNNPNISITEAEPLPEESDENESETKIDENESETKKIESETKIAEKERKDIENIKIQESSDSRISQANEETTTVETESKISQDIRVESNLSKTHAHPESLDLIQSNVQPIKEQETTSQTRDRESTLPKIVDYQEKIDVPPDDIKKGDKEENTDKTESDVASEAQAVRAPRALTAQSDVSSDEEAKFSTKSEAGSPEASKTEEENDISSEQLKTNSLSDMSLSEALNSEGEEAAREAAKAHELQEMIASLSAEAKEATLGYEVAMGVTTSESDVGSSSKDEFKPGYLVPISGHNRWPEKKQPTLVQKELLELHESPEDIPVQAPESPSEKSESSADSKQTEESKISDTDKVEASDLTSEIEHEDHEEDKVRDDKRATAAATTIQSAFRGFKERKQLVEEGYKSKIGSSETLNSQVCGIKNDEMEDPDFKLPLDTQEEQTTLEVINILDTAPLVLIEIARSEVDSICREAEEKAAESLNAPPLPEMTESDYQYDNDDFPAPPDDLMHLNGKNEMLIEQGSSGTPIQIRTGPLGDTEGDSSKTEDTTAPSMLEYDKSSSAQPNEEEIEKGLIDQRNPDEEKDDESKPFLVDKAPESLVKIALSEVDKICQEASEKAAETLMTPPPPEMTSSEYQDDSEDFPAPPEDLMDLNGKTDSAKEDQEQDSSGTPSSDRTVPLGSNTEGDSSKTEDTTAPSLLESEIKSAIPNIPSQQIDDHQESSLTDDNINTEVPVARDSTEGELTLEEDSKEEDLAPTSNDDKNISDGEYPNASEAEKPVPVTEITTSGPTPEAQGPPSESGVQTPEAKDSSLESAAPTPESQEPAAAPGAPTPETQKIASEPGDPIPVAQEPTNVSGRPTPDSKEATSESGRPPPESKEPSTESGRPTPDIQGPATESGRPTPETKEPETESGRPSPASKEPTIESGKPTPDIQEHATESGRPTPDIQEPTTESGRPTPDIHEPTVESGRPTPDIQEPAAESRRPTPDSKEIAAESVKPKTETKESGTESGTPSPDIKELTTKPDQPTSVTKEPGTESGRSPPLGEEAQLPETGRPDIIPKPDSPSTSEVQEPASISPDNMTTDFSRLTPEGEEATSPSTTKPTNEDLEVTPSPTSKPPSAKSEKDQKTNENLSSPLPDGKEQAARVIQAGFRGYKTRKDLKKDNIHHEVPPETPIDSNVSSKNTDITQSTVEADAMNISPNQLESPVIQGGALLNHGSENTNDNQQPEARDDSSSAEKLELSAAKIQAGVRGYLVRKEQKLKKEAAVKIQSTFRGFKTRQKLKQESS